MNLEKSSTDHNMRHETPIPWYWAWLHQQKASADHDICLYIQHAEWAAIRYGW